MLGQIVRCYGTEITVGLFAKVCLIRYLGVLIPIGGENAFGTGGLEGQPHPADSAEQIDKLGTVHVIALHL